MSRGAEQRFLRAQTREQGPPLALAEIFVNFFILLLPHLKTQKGLSWAFETLHRLLTQKNIGISSGIFFLMKSQYFFELGAHAKFQKPRTGPSEFLGAAATE